MKWNTFSAGARIFSMTATGGMNVLLYKNFANTRLAKSVPFSDKRR